MSLAHAVLTSLLEKASSGYDLAQRFDKSIGYFWHATHQQIYRELGRMEAAGWIASSVHPDAGKSCAVCDVVQASHPPYFVVPRQGPGDGERNLPRGPRDQDLFALEHKHLHRGMTCQWIVA